MARRWPDHIAAWIDAFGETFDRAALARGIHAFKDNHHRALLGIDLKGEFMQLSLQCLELLIIFSTFRCQGKIKTLKH